MRRLVVLFCLFLLCIQEIYAQQQVSDELRAYNDYLLSLSCYKASGELNMAIGEKFMEGDIAGVRRLSAEREKLLMQSIDSVLAFRADAKKSEAAAQLVTRLVFNLGFENTGKVLNRFEPGFDPLCLQEVRQSLERESKVRPGMPAADFKVFDREGKEYTLASFKGKYIFLEFSASWCSWCKKEIPSIRQAYERFKDSVVFITIHLDDNRDKWLKDLETHAVPWYCLTDLKAWKSPVAKAYNIAGVPDCFIIGKDGLIKAKELRREEITTGSGAEFTSDCNGICKAKLEENGAVTLDVPLGEYEIKEVNTTYGHVLPSTNSWNLKFVWNSQDEEYVSDISDNTQDGVLDIRNELVSTEVRVTKKDARTSKPVPDTTFGFYTKDNIYDKDGNVILKAGSKITEVKTDKDGKAIIPFSVPVMGEGYGDKDLPINSGDYYFLEENISDSYYISEEPIFVHLEYKNQETPIVTAEAKVINEQTEVEVDKLMIASSVEIPNCHLKISDENGNEIVSWITGDKDSIIVNEKLEEMGYLNFEAKMNENGNIKINGLLHDKE